MRYVLTMIGIILSFTSPIMAGETLVFGGPKNSDMYLKHLELIYQPLGYEVKIKVLPGLRSLSMSDNGKIDGEAVRTSVIESKVRNLIRIPDAISFLDAVVFTKDKQLSIKGWDSLKPYKIGIVRGLKLFEIKTMGMNQEVSTNLTSLFKKLNVGRCDVALYFPDEGMGEIKRLGLTGINYLKPPLERLPLYHYLHKKHKALIPNVTEQIKIHTKAGTFEKLLAEERLKRGL